MDARIVNALKEAVVKYDNGDAFYLCHFVAIKIYNTQSKGNDIAKLMTEHDGFRRWIDEVGFKYRDNYFSGEPWTTDNCKKFTKEFLEDDENEDETECYPLLSPAVKSHEIKLFLKQLDDEGVFTTY